MANPPFFNQVIGSDSNPYEAIRFSDSGKTATVRVMSAVSKKTVDAIPGGFAGYTDNSSQEWDITSDESGRTVTIRRHKDCIWRDTGGTRYSPSNEPTRFYDYNF